MNSSVERAPSDTGRDSASISANPPGLHELLVTFGISLLFFLLMLLQERAFLLGLTNGGAIPYLLWRSIWPFLLIALAVLLPIRARVVFLSGVGTFWSLVVIGDLANLRFFGSVTSIVSAGTLHQLWDVRDSVIDVLHASDWIYPSLFVALSGFAFLPKRFLIGQGAAPATQHRRFVSGAAIGLLLAVISLAAWLTPIYEDTHHIGRDKWVMPSDHWGSRYSYSTYAATFGLYNYHAHDVLEFIDFGRSRSALTDSRLSMIDKIVERKRALNRIETPLAGIAKGRRIVVIQLEAIVHWVRDLEFEGEPVMPFLSQLARDGLSWDYVMDVTAVGRTSDAEFAVMTGLLPDTSRPNSFAHPDRARSYLPRALSDLGYSTASYHGYKVSFWNRDYTHPVYGFQQMFFDEVYGDEEVLGLGVPDGVVYDYLVDRLVKEEGPSFSFVISLSSHHPFVYTPAEYNTLFPGLAPDDGWGLLGPYLRSARYTDDALAAFFARMKENDLLEDTLFVIYGDHDAGALHAEKTLPQMSEFAYTVAEERVPFVVVVPGKESEVTAHREGLTDATAGLHDTFPTIMHLIGEPVPHGVLGTNLLVPDKHRDPVPLLSRMGDMLFAYRQCIHTSRGSGCIDPEKVKNRAPSERIPSLMEGIRDQVIVRDLLDHPEYWDRPEQSPELAANGMAPASAP
jgi:lipoteichoic acid synthase